MHKKSIVDRKQICAKSDIQSLIRNIQLKLIAG